MALLEAKVAVQEIVDASNRAPAAMGLIIGKPLAFFDDAVAVAAGERLFKKESDRFARYRKSFVEFGAEGVLK